MELMQLLNERVQVGLRQSSIRKVSEWACEYRVMGGTFPGKWSHKNYPWLVGIQDCEAEHVVNQKAAQMGVTEAAMNLTFSEIDLFGGSVLYVLPSSKPDASDFSSARFDPALEMSDHLNNLFSETKNVNHKRAGNANLYIRGSRSKSQLKSVPVSKIILDELDEMNQENLAMIPERMSGQLRKQEFDLSTPTISGYGISERFENSTQNFFAFNCPHCSRLIRFLPEMLVITADDFNDPKIRDSYYKCNRCDMKLPQETKADYLASGVWVPEYTNRLIEGFHISQLYSLTVKPYHLAMMVVQSESDALIEQELYNSKFGLPNDQADARISLAQIKECIGEHTKRDIPLNSQTMVTMGVDVGKKLHVQINEWYVNVNRSTDINIASIPRVVKEITVKEFHELDVFMQDFNVNFCVVDANPETRLAKAFCERFQNRAARCWYGNNIKGKDVNYNAENVSVTVDRTSWLDQSMGRFKRGTKGIILPQDASAEYIKHMQEPIRLLRLDRDGNPTATYINKNADHFAHANNYAEIALCLGASFGVNQNIRSM